MADPKPPKKRFRFTLRASLVLLTLMAVLLAFYANRYSKMRRAVDLLEENNVSFFCAKESELPWYDRLPWLSPPPRITTLRIGRGGANLEAVAGSLNNLGTVKRLELYNPKLQNLKTLSQIESIEIIHGDWGITAEQIRPFMSHKLKNVSVSGADCSLPEDVLELLYSIPTLESVGTAQGSFDVPDALKTKRPDVSVYLTDFPA